MSQPFDSEVAERPETVRAASIPIRAAAQAAAVVREVVKSPAQPIQIPKPVVEVPPSPSLPAVAPFYLQLWQAGSCAVLMEIDEPGLEPGTAPHRLFSDILRAAELPAPRLLADFRWPLIRNQADRSAASASLGLQAFVQARLEEWPVRSLGCFGGMAALLAEGDVDQARLLSGREEALEGLPPTWFSAGFYELMAQPQAKARLWKLIKRVKSRWMLSNE
ncbi:hypothetical protein [Pseudomonas sp.]|uniref:hypothetical protein n=1 Tax=Pseudomonas sp. TaxID=306 RepID=UPI00272B7A13|nr:hypothetical protein [Pseudomonas sp.]